MSFSQSNNLRDKRKSQLVGTALGGDSLQRNCYKNTKTEAIYHFGIIDFLQEWDINKKMENNAKLTMLTIQNQYEERISAVEPVSYQKRFAKFMKTQVLKPALNQHYLASALEGIDRSTEKNLPANESIYQSIFISNFNKNL